MLSANNKSTAAESQWPQVDQAALYQLQVEIDQFLQGRQRTIRNRNSLHGRQVVVSELPSNSTWQQVKDLFRSRCNVVRVNILYHGESGGPNALVLLNSQQDAVNAIQYFNGLHLDGRTVKVHMDTSLDELQCKLNAEPLLSVTDIPARLTVLPQDKRPVSVKIFNLPHFVGWQDLKDLLREAGDVMRADIRPALDSSTTGFVTYSHWLEACLSYKLFNNFVWMGHKLIVRIDQDANLPTSQKSDPSPPITDKIPIPESSGKVLNKQDESPQLTQAEYLWKPSRFQIVQLPQSPRLDLKRKHQGSQQSSQGRSG
ncbi:hypothetical protein MIR68_002921 [Amoeboaphelidium protococcarum]|nr:hypothetical protein MIR68_002921 [Amoeboaphelidium protococcarum]